MRSISGFIIRSSSFIQKELAEILRQTPLILALILGPFLILLLFGIGYKNEARPLNTLFVVPADEASLRSQVEQYATTLGPQLKYMGVVNDDSMAMQMLERGDVDVVAVVPDQIEQQIRASKQPTVTLYHREIDPQQANYVQYFAEIYVDELNRRILESSVAQGQKEVASLQTDLQAAKASAHAMTLAFQAGDAAAAMQHQQETQKTLDAVTLGAGASLGLLQGVENITGANGGQVPNTGSAGGILDTLNALSAASADLSKTQAGQGSYSAQAQKSAQMEKDLDSLDQQLSDFRSISPHVLVSPFVGQAKNVNGISLSSSNFFSPGVIVLLLQHLAVTFAALSIVRERLSGTMELFRVSPVKPFEVLLGKYLSYMLLGSIIAAIISALMILVLKVPMLGSVLDYALVLLALLFASLGYGFVISLTSRTNSQAVQYSMLILLTAIFFSGFLLDLRLLQPGVQVLAWALPATYGMRLLQEIMFRANSLLAMPNYLYIAGLTAIGLVLFFISWILLRKEMKLH